MTETELIQIIQSKNCPLIKHENMRDAAFWPTALEINTNAYKVTGFWYSNVFEDLMGDVFGHPLRETVTIKKSDLPSWKIHQKPTKE